LNNLSFIYSNSFKELYDLKALDLSYNMIQSIEDGSFEALNFLDKLYLNGNPIRNIFTRPVLTGLGRIMFIFTSVDVDLSEESLWNLKSVFELREFKSLLDTTYFKTKNVVFQPNSIKSYSKPYCLTVIELVKAGLQLNLVDSLGVDKFLSDCVNVFVSQYKPL
jgi:Leucine-rich repeat (LRR) protein